MKKHDLSLLRVSPEGRLIETKDYSFASTSRALTAYDEACHIIDQFTPYEPEYFIKLIGNVLRIPVWFPYVPAN